MTKVGEVESSAAAGWCNKVRAAPLSVQRPFMQRCLWLSALQQEGMASSVR